MRDIVPEDACVFLRLYPRVGDSVDTKAGLACHLRCLHAWRGFVLLGGVLSTVCVQTSVGVVASSVAQCLMMGFGLSERFRLPFFCHTVE